MQAFDATSISTDDRGVNYGDGLFTTIRISSGTLELWDLHQKRLVDGCEQLGIEVENWQSLFGHCESSAKSHDSAVLKIVVTRGVGGRGYTPPEQACPNIWVKVHSYPKQYQTLALDGVSLELLNTKLSLSANFSGIKHLNRLDQVAAKQECLKRQLDDGLVCDITGNVIETSIANIFVRINGQWVTPDLSQSGICGVMREHIIKQSHKFNQPIAIQRLNVDAINESEAAFICNSLMGIVPVQSLLGRSLNTKLVAECKWR